MWIQARANMTYAVSKFRVNEEPVYSDDLKYLSRIGQSLEQVYGLVAERLFVDDIEARKSPVQSFGGNPPMGGDIKIPRYQWRRKNNRSRWSAPRSSQNTGDHLWFRVLHLVISNLM